MAPRGLEHDTQPRDRERGQREAERAAVSPSGPTQPSLRRMREFGVRPKRELGQNFLVDSNLLGVIERAAELAPADVVLEVGGGLGVLSEHLAQRVSHLHVVELDPALEAPLRDALRSHPNASLHLADAMTLDLAALTPAPTAVVANLPYGVAASVVLRTIEELPAVRRWVAMVQREVGRRLAAAPSTSSYGLPSVLAQLACDVRVVRSVSRSVFFPVPNVDSVLVRLDRRAPPAAPAVRALAQAAFAHRRKALAGSLALAPGAPPGTRAAARSALARLGHAPEARAESLAPAEFVALAELLAA
jgi:16S rRNA (adenine1518-N6/adenine1519-N6)-dimethyltransferase